MEIFLSSLDMSHISSVATLSTMTAQAPPSRLGPQTIAQSIARVLLPVFSSSLAAGIILLYIDADDC